MRIPGLLPLLALAWAPAARAACHLLLSAEGDVAVFVDDQGVGDLTGGAELPLALDDAGSHRVEVRTVSGRVLHKSHIEVKEEEVLRVRWTGTALQVEKAEVEAPAAEPGRRSVGERAVDALQTAQAGATVASVVLPGSSVVGAAQSAATVVGAGSTLVRSAQDAASRSASRPPPRAGGREDHDLTALERSGFDPYAASGGRPDFDASLCAVTLVVPEGFAATVQSDGQTVATLGPGASVQTVLFAPGLHTVQVFDAASGALLYRGRLTASAGQAFDLAFSAAEAPVASLPDVWR
jgi:hypothetical protein